MLTGFEWADRMAVPITFIQAAGQPEAAGFMSILALYRNDGIDRHTWFGKANVRRTPSLGPGGGRSQRDMMRASFFNELLNKCINFYGAPPNTDADPLALARHPWSLTQQEFTDTFEKFDKTEVAGPTR